MFEVVIKQASFLKNSFMKLPRSIASPMSSTKNSSKQKNEYFFVSFFTIFFIGSLWPLILFKSS